MVLKTSRISGPWSREGIETYLKSIVVPLRLSVNNKNGWPIVVSLWFLYEDGQIFAASRQSSKIVEYIGANSRCGFEIAPESPPYFGVRGYGAATLSPDQDAALLKRLADRYLGSEETPFRQWLVSAAKEETAISIAPKTWMSWDYRSRMNAAN